MNKILRLGNTDFLLRFEERINGIDSSLKMICGKRMILEDNFTPYGLYEFGKELTKIAENIVNIDSDKVDKVLEIIKILVTQQLDTKNKDVNINDIIKEGFKEGLSDSEIYEAINDLIINGLIFSSRPNTYQVV